MSHYSQILKLTLESAIALHYAVKVPVWTITVVSPSSLTAGIHKPGNVENEGLLPAFNSQSKVLIPRSWLVKPNSTTAHSAMHTSQAAQPFTNTSKSFTPDPHLKASPVANVEDRSMQINNPSPTTSRTPLCDTPVKSATAKTTPRTTTPPTAHEENFLVQPLENADRPLECGLTIH